MSSKAALFIAIISLYAVAILLGLIIYREIATTRKETRRMTPLPMTRTPFRRP